MGSEATKPLPKAGRFKNRVCVEFAINEGVGKICKRRQGDEETWKEQIARELFF